MTQFIINDKLQNLICVWLGYNDYNDSNDSDLDLDLYWERPCELVTQLTISDKLRILIHDIEE